MQENPAHTEALVLAEAVGQSVSLLVGHRACNAIQEISGTFDGSFKGFVRLTVLGREFAQSNEFSDLRTDHDTSLLPLG